jgi:hypothetical protein
VKNEYFAKNYNLKYIQFTLNTVSICENGETAINQGTVYDQNSNSQIYLVWSIVFQNNFHKFDTK